MVERYNGIILSGLRRMSAAVPGAPVQDLLPEVLAGLRFLPRRVGYQPYLLVFKQFPHCLGRGMDVQGVVDEGDLPAGTAHQQD